MVCQFLTHHYLFIIVCNNELSHYLQDLNSDDH